MRDVGDAPVVPPRRPRSWRAATALCSPRSTSRARGFDAPSDLSLISFDDTPMVHFTHPPLAAISQPIAQVTARAVELIIADQTGRETPDGPIVVPASLILRNSTAPPRRG